MCQSQSDLFIYWATSSDTFIWSFGWNSSLLWEEQYMVDLIFQSSQKPKLLHSSEHSLMGLLLVLISSVTGMDIADLLWFVEWWQVLFLTVQLLYHKVFFHTGINHSRFFFFFFLSTKVSVQRKEREKEKDNKEHKIRRTEHWSTSKKQKIRQRTTLWRHPLFPSFHSFSVWLL